MNTPSTTCPNCGAFDWEMPIEERMPLMRCRTCGVPCLTEKEQARRKIEIEYTLAVDPENPSLVVRGSKDACEFVARALERIRDIEARD